MILVSFIIFLLVVFLSYFVYFFCKKVIYKLNKRVLARNLAVLRNGSAMAHFDSLNDDEKRVDIITKFFLILGYNTFDSREFKKATRFNQISADYVTKKWNKSKLCKRSLYIKYFDFTELSVNSEKGEFDGVCNLDELMDKKYFDGEYYVLTNGYIYLFFSSKRVKGSKKYDFCFNIKRFSKQDIAKLAYFTKQCMFFEVADVFVDQILDFLPVKFM